MGLIDDRVQLARRGLNKKAIARLKSGWFVLGADQRIPGYCLLLSDPVVPALNDLSIQARMDFLSDMTRIGDALGEVLSLRAVNYSILGNSDRELHAHIHPRFESEAEGLRIMPPWFYHFSEAKVDFEIPYSEEELIECLRSSVKSWAST